MVGNTFLRSHTSTTQTVMTSWNSCEDYYIVFYDNPPNIKERQLEDIINLSDVIVLVYDLTSLESIEKLKQKYIPNILKAKKQPNFGVIICGNKQDLPAKDIKEIQTNLKEIISIFQKSNIDVIQIKVSCKNQNNIGKFKQVLLNQTNKRKWEYQSESARKSRQSFAQSFAQSFCSPVQQQNNKKSLINNQQQQFVQEKDIKLQISLKGSQIKLKQSKIQTKSYQFNDNQIKKISAEPDKQQQLNQNNQIQKEIKAGNIKPRRTENIQINQQKGEGCCLLM